MKLMPYLINALREAGLRLDLDEPIDGDKPSKAAEKQRNKHQLGQQASRKPVNE